MDNILITGASSGLGAEFALQYAARGTTLFLTGRDTERLESVAHACRKKGATVHTATVDVTNKDAMEKWVGMMAADTGIDLVIANAGISGGFNGDDATEIVKDYKIFDVNLTGVMHTIFAVLPHMMSKKAGHIVVISSIAGILPMPSAPAYSASKAAVRYYAEGLRHKLAPHNITISVICPGFIKSRMTDANDFPMPFLMDTEPAVRYMRRKMAARAPRVYFPWQMAIPLKLLALLPESVSAWIFASLPNKKPL